MEGLLRAEAHRQSTNSVVRGGGRLYDKSPLANLTEAEMIVEAKIRLQHNKQRQQLKKLLQGAAEGGSVVKTEDLMVACQLAKVPVKEDLIGHAKAVPWKGFQEALEYPPLHDHTVFAGVKLPPTRREIQAQYSPRSIVAHARSSLAPQAIVGAALASGDPEFDMEVYSHWLTLKTLMNNRFKEIRRAFRLIDQDASGACDRKELKTMLNAMFNLNARDAVLDRLIDMADFDGDGVINFAEFARLMTAENVFNMKNTLQADLSNWGAVDPNPKFGPTDNTSSDHEDPRDYAEIAKKNLALVNGGMVDFHGKLRRTGPGLAKLQQAHRIYKAEINKRYSSYKEAFDAIDEDGSGLIRRGELRKFLGGLSKSIADKTISALIDFCDSDGDAKSLDRKEFIAMLEADKLGGPDGYDPQFVKKMAMMR